MLNKCVSPGIKLINSVILKQNGLSSSDNTV